MNFIYHYKLFWRMVFLAFIISIPVFAENQDGPYVFYYNNQAEVVYIGDENVNRKKLPANANEFTCFADHDRGLAYKLVIPEITGDKFQNVKYWFAISDVHGQYQLFSRLLKKAKIIDSNGNWIFKKGHFIITGDTFDRGSQVIEILWHTLRLQQQALTSGGKVHYLLGNHEIMVLRGKDKYLHDKYLRTVRMLDMKIDNIFDDKSFLGRWLRKQNSIVKVNETLFMHGGTHPWLVDKKFTVNKINVYIRKLLANYRQTGEQDSSTKKLIRKLRKSKGVFWYRGFFRKKENKYSIITDDELTKIFIHFQISRIVVGHTTFNSIAAYHNQRIIGIDAGMKYGKKGEGLMYRDGQYSVISTDN